MPLRRALPNLIVVFFLILFAGLAENATAQTSIIVGGYIYRGEEKIAGVPIVIKTTQFVSPAPIVSYTTATSGAGGYFSASVTIRGCSAPSGGSVGFEIRAIGANGFISGSGGGGGCIDDQGYCPLANCSSVGISSEPDANPQDFGAKSCNIAVGKPVNVSNGNMYLTQTDYVLPGLGESIAINRTYNSLSSTSGLFGIGWSNVYDESLQGLGNSDFSLLRLNLPDGQAIYFGDAGNNIFTAATRNFYGQIVRNADNTYTLTFKDGRVHQFNSFGRLLFVKDRNGNQTTLNFNGSGALTGITDRFGRTLTVTLNSSSYVESVSDSLGTAATYVYNPNGTLKTVTYPDGSKSQFEYLTLNVGGAARPFLTTVKDALNNVLEHHEYYPDGKAKTSEKHGGVEKYTLDYSNPAFTTVTDALARTTKYYYDRSRGQAVVTKIEGNCNCGAGAQTTNYQYDDKLNKTKEIDALGRETVYTYDGSGNRLTATDLLGTETYTYNPLGQMLTRTDRMSGVTTNSFDPTGNLLTSKDALNKTTTFTYTPIGQLKTVTDPRGNTTTLNYDANAAYPKNITDADNKVTALTFDLRGKIKTVTDVSIAATHTTAYDYDLHNRLKKITFPDAKFVTYNYDLAGRKSEMIDARGKTTVYGYDSAYRLTSVTDPLNHATTMGYDLMSNRKSMTDALGNTTDYEYDDFDRLKKIIYPLAATGAARLEENIEYTAVGKVKKRIDSAARETSYEYDTSHRLKKITDPDAKVTEFGYNNRSQMTKVTDALNQVYDFTYDPLGRTLSQTRAGSTMTFEYDQAGNRTRRTDYAGRPTTYEYDALNRLKKIEYLPPPVDAGTAAAPNTPNQTATYTYDALSRLKTAVNEAGVVTFNYNARGDIENTTDVYGRTLAYGYDANRNREMLKLDGTDYASYGYDFANRLTAITSSADNALVSFGYDDANRQTSRMYPNGVTTTIEYDGMSRLKRLKDLGASVNLDRQYSYNAANQIYQIIEPASTKTFGYDNLDRLTAVTNPAAGNESYNFDAVGNRTASHKSATYDYQPFNKLAATATGSYNYDANGNMVSKLENGKVWRLTWDYENRLTQATDKKVKIRYIYDALGRRVARNAGAKGVTKFTYDGADVILDENADGTTTKYLNGAGIDNKLRQTVNGQTNYFLADHLGSTNALVDTNGNITSQTNYDAFGNATNSNFSTRYQYTGRELDNLTNLNYYRARQYSAELGRFISEDPIGFAGGDINLYGYVGNNAIKFVDPWGLCPECWELNHNPKTAGLRMNLPSQPASTTHVDISVGVGTPIFLGGSASFKYSPNAGGHFAFTGPVSSPGPSISAMLLSGDPSPGWSAGASGCLGLCLASGSDDNPIGGIGIGTPTFTAGSIYTTPPFSEWANYLLHDPKHERCRTSPKASPTPAPQPRPPGQICALGQTMILDESGRFYRCGIPY